MQHILRVLVKQTAFIYLTEIISRAANFVSAILIIKYMGETALGKISYASSLVLLFAVFTDLGYAMISVKNFAQYGNEDKQVLNPGFSLKFISSVAVFALLLFYQVFVYEDQVVSLLISLLALNIVISSLSFPYKYAFGGLRQFQYESILKTILAILSLIMLVVILKAYPNIVLVGAGIPLICASLSFLYFWRLNEKLKIVNAKLIFDVAKLAAFFKSCLPFSIVTIVVMFHQNIGIILLKEYSEYSSMGVFIIGYKVIEALNMIPNIILGVTFPALSALFINWNQKAEHIVLIIAKYLMIISVPLTLLVCFLGGDTLNFILNKQYAESGKILAVLSWVIVPSFLYSITGGLINASPKPGANTTIHIVMAGLFFILLFSFLPTWGVMGLAYSMVLVEWLALIIRSIYVRKRICKTGHISNLIKVLVVAGVAFVPLFVQSDFSSGFISLILYMTFLIIFRIVNKDEFLIFYGFAGSYGREEK